MKHSKILTAWLILLAGIVVSGCLPIELSVSKDGQILIPREEGFCILDLKAKDRPSAKVAYAPKSGKPAFAVFAPDGKRFLAVSQTKGGEMGMAFKVEQVAIAGAKAKALLTATNLTYVQLSPDGKHATITRISDKKSAAVGQNMPELILVDTASGEKRNLASDVSAIHRWFPDSKHVLALQISSKDKEEDQYTGKLVKLDVATGKAQPVASVLGGKKGFFDLSPDGDKVLFTALAAAKADEKVPAKSDAPAKLHELDIKTGAVRAVKGDVAYAIYSPKGDKALIGSQSEENDRIKLAVADASLKSFKTVATDAASSAGGADGSSDIYPGWLNNDTVHYIALRTVFGTAANNYHLTRVSADGKNRADLQPTINVEPAPQDTVKTGIP